MTGPLSHVRVLDLSRVLAGPWASQTLADLGATVIKVEHPDRGDDTRSWGPPFATAADGGTPAESAYFLAANRGKRSVAINFERNEGQDLVRRLAAGCDVVIENFKAGGLARYGLDYDRLRTVNPRLIHCSITGFGQDGPRRDQAGYDFMIQGTGGLMSLTGEPEGMPVKVGVAVTDVFTGLYAVIAIQAALAHRDRTGQGQHIDLALLDVQVAVLANQAMNYLVSGTTPRRLGNAHPNIVPYQAFATADGHLILAVGNDGQFARFAAVADHPEWADDPRFATNPARVAHRAVLVPAVADAIHARPTRFWLDQLGTVGVPCGPINDLAAVFDDPQVQARGLRLDLPHPVAGTVPSVANPIRFSETPIAYDRAPPILGADTRAVLGQDLGLDADTIAALLAARVIGIPAGF